MNGVLCVRRSVVLLLVFRRFLSMQWICFFHRAHQGNYENASKQCLKMENIEMSLMKQKRVFARAKICTALISNCIELSTFIV